MSIQAHIELPFPAAERRDGDRVHLYLATQGVLPEGMQANVEIHNISSGGLLMETGLPLVKGSRLEVELPNNGLTRAVVVWAGEGVFGCAFDEPISAAALGAVQLKSDAPMPPQIGRSSGAEASAAFGKKLEQMRKRCGLTLANVADALGVSKPTVWAWEKGKARPLDERIPAIAEVLGVEVEELSAASFLTGWASLVEESRVEIAKAIGVRSDQVRIMIDL